MDEKQVFLVQSSGKPASHYTVEFDERTYADEVSKHFYYRHEDWELKKRDVEFGNARPGDLVLHYCTGDVESNPSRIKNIYEVASLEKIENDIDSAIKKGDISEDEAERLKQYPHVMRLRPHISLKRGLELSLVRRWVTEGKLSETMNNCGRLGFNICQIDMADYEAIVKWDNEQLPELPTPVAAILEEDLRHYIAEQPSLGIFGRAFTSYKLYSDDSGRTGELFDTRTVGQIDLLFQDEERGDFLVMELKRTEDTSDSAVGQIARYMGWVGENIAQGNKVRGLLVVRSASEELRYAVKAIRDCRLATYDLVFKFKVTQ